jgi:hypothetical protein
VYFHLAGKEFTQKGRRVFEHLQRPQNLTVAGSKTFFLTLKFARTEKYQITLLSFGEA